MKTDIIFNEDAEASHVYVMAVYKTDVSSVWNHFTQSALLDLWWAPKPWRCETVSQDFREGGIWRYAMLGPGGERHDAQVKYGEITDHRSFDATDAFCDENGNVNIDFPQVKWLFGFTGVEEGTKVTINIHFKTQEEMRKILEMGFKEGFMAGLTQLDGILGNLKMI